MNFSELMRHTNLLVEFSPDGHFLATVVQQRLIVRSTKNLEVLHVFTCQDVPQNIQWSPDSTLIACAMYKRALVQIWSPRDPSWYCKIHEGSAGLIQILWSPDSRHILTTSEFHIRITLWSLINTSFSYIRYPKNVEKNCAFSPDGKYFVLLERRDCRDHVSVFDCKTWQMLQHFETDTKDAAGILWSPDSALSIWESPLEQKVLLYTLNGARLGRYSPHDEGPLGIKSVAWSPSGQFLCIGCYDQKIRVVNHVVWKPVVEFPHSSSAVRGSTVFYQETEKVIKSPTVVEVCKINKYEVMNERPVNLASPKQDTVKPNPKVGVGVCSFSADSRYIATLNENNPCNVWIWSMEDLQLAAMLKQLQVVKHVQWDPIKNRLVICTGTSKIYLWSPAECIVVDVPQEVSFEIHSFKWHSSGEILLLLGKDQTCLCYL